MITPIPDPPPQAPIAIIHWSSFYRAPLTIHITSSNAYRRLKAQR